MISSGKINNKFIKMEEIINGLKQIKTRVDSGTITTVNGTETLLSKQIASMLEKAINYTRCSTLLKRESKSFFNVKNLADLKRLYPNRDSYNADVCDGYIKYYVDKQLVITTALMV